MITSEIKEIFIDMYNKGEYNAEGMLELIGTSFIADAPSIIGVPNEEYIAAEIDWYKKGSLNVNDIDYDPVPKIWKAISSDKGEINSNYGWCIFSAENGSQYNNVINELLSNPNTRRASMIYTRPSMHTDYNRDGMNDFICTEAVDYFIRDDRLHCVVKMRSNDVVFGYKNDYAWQKFILDNVSKIIGVPIGTMIWQASSLHIYPQHLKLLKENGNG